MLSCSCPDISDYDSDGWFYYPPNDFSVLNTLKRKRCISCKRLINIGSLVIEFTRARYARNDVEERRYGDGNDIPLASYFMCEKCGEIYLNLSDIGYCLDISESMQAQMDEYHKLSGFNKESSRIE